MHNKKRLRSEHKSRSSTYASFTNCIKKKKKITMKKKVFKFYGFVINNSGFEYLARKLFCQSTSLNGATIFNFFFFFRCVPAFSSLAFRKHVHQNDGGVGGSIRRRRHRRRCHQRREPFFGIRSSAKG